MVHEEEEVKNLKVVCLNPKRLVRVLPYHKTTSRSHADWNEHHWGKLLFANVIWIQSRIVKTRWTWSSTQNVGRMQNVVLHKTSALMQYAQ